MRAAARFAAGAGLAFAIAVAAVILGVVVIRLPAPTAGAVLAHGYAVTVLGLLAVLTAKAGVSLARQPDGTAPPS